MTQQEQNELSKVVNKSLDQKVLPELENIKEKLDEHDKKFEIIIDAVAETKVDVTQLQEDVNDLGFTVERIETRLNSVIKDQDAMSLKTRQLNHRVLKLETKRTLI
jgi:chromosome segregation ATPase